MDRIRVLIVDDHPLFRDGMHGLLDSVEETQVVGEATTGAEAINQAKALQPDVILMDIKMPGINGIEATREIVSASPHISVLMVTMLEDDEAEKFGLTLKTVRNHVSNIFSKLQVADRAQAVIRAREAGLGHGKTEGEYDEGQDS